MISLSAVCVTPFADGRLDERRLRKRVEALAEAGVDANLCSYGPGEGGQLSLGEAEQVYRWAVDESVHRVRITAAGIPATLGGAREHALIAADTGVDVVQLPQPRREPPVPAVSQAVVEEFWDQLLEIVPIPCQVAVHTQQSPGLAAAPDLVSRLAARHRNLTTVAVTADDRYLLQLLDTVPARVGVVTTSLDTLLVNLQLGVAGVQCLELNLWPRLTRRLIQHHQNHETGEALKVAAQLARLELAAFGTQRFPYTLKLLKAALELVDGTGGNLRPPYLPLTPAEVARFNATIQ